jgi:phenylalanyl-tRNA synthetase beta chain
LLYELARTWHGSLDPLPDERRHVGMAIVGARNPRHWQVGADTLDFFDLKGIVDTLCATFRVAVSYEPSRHPSLHPGRTAEVCADGQHLGVLGQLHPTIAERFDLEGAAIFVAELDFEHLLQVARPLQGVQTPSRFPPADRDIAIVIDESTPHAEVEAVIRTAAGSLLESVQIFDVYRGESIAAGRKSLAFSLRYRASERTLGDDEVSAVHARVEAALGDRFGAEVRGR